MSTYKNACQHTKVECQHACFSEHACPRKNVMQVKEKSHVNMRPLFLMQDKHKESEFASHTTPLTRTVCELS